MADPKAPGAAVPPAKPPPPGKPPAAPAASAAGQSTKRFQLLCKTQEEEDQVDLGALRTGVTTGLVGAIANMIKGALGGGILSGHSAYMYAGLVPAMVLNISFGIFLGYCFHIASTCSQIMSRRCKVPSMSYPDVAEASVGLFPNPKVSKLSLVYRHFLDIIIFINYTGACACYQLMMAKTIKQLVEDNLELEMEGLNGMPHLRVYIACMIIPVIAICLITQLKYLSPFSLIGNLLVALCCAVTIYYGIKENPTFEGLQPFMTVYGVCRYMGMSIFGMSVSGIFMPTENHMKEPQKFYIALIVGFIFIVSLTFFTSFFGYVGYRNDCKSPITLNFPMEIFPMILKACIAVMIYVTHAVNFYMPFNVFFYYLKPKLNQQKLFMWELILRALMVTFIGLTAIAFPNVDALIGFLGSFCVCNMAFICPNTIYLLVHWHRPGLGTMKWRLWRSVIFIGIGLVVFVCGTSVSFAELLKTVF